MTLPRSARSARVSSTEAVPHTESSRPPGSSRRSAKRVFVLYAATSFAVMSAWAVTMPLYSADDEPSQVTHAAALFRGHLIGRPLKGPYTMVTVPASFGVGALLEQCYQAKPTKRASCARHWHLGVNLVHVINYDSRYPPLYYALVGAPTLFDEATSAVTWMRLLSALASSVLLGLACMSVAMWSRNRLLPVGLMVALTPTALWLGAMVNPSGFEIAAAICLWCSGLVLALERTGDPPRALVATVAVAAAVLMLARGLSPLWTLLILATLILVAGPAAALRLLRRHRDVQVAAGAFVTVATAAVIWIVVVHALALGHAYIPRPGVKAGPIIAAEFGQTGGWLAQMVGLLGWNDTTMPLVTYLAWAAAVGTLLVLAAVVGRYSETAVLGGLVVGVLVIPVVLEFIEIRKSGFVWVGRYTLPLAVGVPLLAAAIIGRTDLPARLMRRLAGVLLIILAAGGFLGFAEALRRFAVGVDGPLNFLVRGWAPPEGTATALIWYLAAIAVLAAMLWRLVNAKAMAEGAPEPKGWVG